MFKRLLMAVLVTAALGAGTRPVMAQQTFGGLLTTNLNQKDTGTFHVSVTRETPTSSFWDVLVYYVSTAAGSPIASPFLDQVNVSLLNNPSPSAGDAARETLIAASNGKVGAGGVNGITGPFLLWNNALNGDEDQALFTNKRTNGTPGRIRNGYAFTGKIQIDPTEPPVRGVYFQVGGFGSGSGDGFYPPSFTPEGASLLLFLPGLIPVAIGLRRRRLNKPAGE
jgi:hypothetical protein